MPEHRVAIRLPREIVRASAGTGKTFRLSSRYLALLNAGAPSAEILASTFTRKAAGEILERILLRLANVVAPGGEDEARLLEAHTRLDGAPALDRARAAQLLVGAVREMHRLRVSTLDAFFHQVARTFTLELGLPPAWDVADDAQGERLRTEAIDQLLDAVDPDELIELLRMYRSGDVVRGVHGELFRIVDELQRIHRDLDPSVPAPWGFPDGAGASPGPGERRALAERIRELPVPLTAKGHPRKHWADGARHSADALEAGDDEAVFARGPFAKLLAGEPGFDRVLFDGEGAPWAALFPAVRDLARRGLQHDLHHRAQALGRLASRYEDASRRVQERAGRYRFEDIPHLLLSGDATGRGPELHYRLDGRIRHILLDEFQDTSLLQWRTLEPLAGEILQSADGDRAILVVADPKQSIYGWRGGEPRLLETIARTAGIEIEGLDESWRSARPVLDAVNRIFAALPGSGALDEIQRAEAERWAESFAPHRPAPPRTDLAGFVRVAAAAGEDHRRSLRPSVLRAAAREVVHIRAAAPGATIGVLCRTGSAVTRVVHELRSLGVDVSEERGGPVTDAWPVHLALAPLRLADHPGDELARYLVATSPLADTIGLHDPRGEAAAAEASRRIRRALLDRGYGRVVDGWAATLRERSTPRDAARLAQLVELAFAHDAAGAGLRPSDFVRTVEHTRMEAPGGALVRVMTIHGAKGLEFDAVVLPDLEGALRKGGGVASPLPVRDDPSGPVVRVFPHVRAGLLPLFPEVRAAAHEADASGFRDELGTLYVALTRARHALHLVVEEGRADKATCARLVREGLGIAGDAGPDAPAHDAGGDTVLLEEGEPAWAARAGKDRPAPGRGAAPRPLDPGAIRLRGGERRRHLPRATPSDLEGEGTRTVADLLRVGGAEARLRGTVAHAWIEAVEWLEEGVPSGDVLLARAAELGLERGRAEALLADFTGWLQKPALRDVLSRSEFPEGTRVERELAFLHRDRDRVLAGSVDRLVLTPAADGRFDRALVVDFKTDRTPDPAALDRRVELYRPQLSAYRRVIAARLGLALDRVAGRLVFLEAGVARDV